MRSTPTGDGAYVAALLHDTIKGAISHDDLAAHVDDAETMRLIDLLTHREGETVDDFYLRRSAADPIAARIKHADLTDKLGPQDVDVDPAHTARVAAEAHDRLARLDKFAEGSPGSRSG